SGWDYRMAPDGTLTITTPDGKTVVTRPSGPVAAYRREQARAEQAKWDAQQKRTHPGVPAGHPTTDHRTDDAATPTYWHRRAQRVRAERRAAKRGRARPATPPDSRKVPLESQVEKRLAELLEDPPPFRRPYGRRYDHAAVDAAATREPLRRRVPRAVRAVGGRARRRAAPGRAQRGAGRRARTRRRRIRSEERRVGREGGAAWRAGA